MSDGSPVSYPVHVSRLPRKGMAVRIEADAAQRALLAAVHGLRSVESFIAQIEVSAWKKGGVRVSGKVEARIVQDCIVTLEPVEETVGEEVSALFLPEGSRLALPKRTAEGEIVLDPEGEDAPETFHGDTVDVGQLAEEFFALGINPYPRRPGVAVEIGGDGAGEQRGPLYEKLKSLRKKP